MAAVKTCWSILVLEDHPDLREILKSNFAALFDDAIRVDFAASICHAVDKVKRQMQQGLPYDVFWIDLYLDYFSYENARGEIVSASSFSEIVDTTAFMRHFQLSVLSPQSLASTLHLQITPAHKNLQEYDTYEKLQLLEKFTPFCLPEAKSCYETLLSLLKTYLQSNDCAGINRAAENKYGRYALDSVFRLLSNWVSSPKRQFSLSEANLTKWNDPQNVSILPPLTEKSDQSWTIFRDWVKNFYGSVALGAKELEEYTAANPLLLELKRVTPTGYPQFLINTAYEGRQHQLQESATVWNAEDLIIAGNAFKGEKKDTAFADYLSLLCCRLRRPYLLLRSHRRGTSAFILDEKFLPPAFILGKEIYPDACILDDSDLGLGFTIKSFYPDLLGQLQRIAEASPEFIQNLKWRALRDLEEYLRERLPVEIRHQRLYIPAAFLHDQSGHERFHLKVQTIFGKEYERGLTFDEGRWLFWELACRRWFPKCFYIHSRWTPFVNNNGERVYFFPLHELLAKALKHAAVDHPTLFSPVKEIEELAKSLRPTAAFNDPESNYLAAFDWLTFDENLFDIFERHHKSNNSNPILTQAQRLLHLAKYMLAELKIRRLTTKLFDWHSFTPATLCETLEKCAFSPAGGVIDYYLRLIGNAANTPRLITDDYLPRIQNFLSVIFCFYTLPVDTLVTFYNFWLKKQIPNTGTRPIEKFSAMRKKLEGLRFIQSLELPAQAEKKNNFLFIPSALKAHQFQIILQRSDAITPADAEVKTATDLTRMPVEEFLNYLTAQSL